MKEILKKLSEINKEVTTMSKDGYNDFQKYKYLSETQITCAFKKLFDKYGILFVHDSEITHIHEWVNNKDSKRFLTSVKVSYQFIDVATGESIKGSVIGQGEDAGDKGVYKAITGAVKYLFMKNFLIPTGDDPENEKSDTKKKLDEAASHPKKNYDDKPKIDKWMSENQFNSIKKLIAEGQEEKALVNYETFCEPPYGMKKEYKTELKTLLKIK